MRYVFLVMMSTFSILACSPKPQPNSLQLNTVMGSNDLYEAIDGLRVYCKACHAIAPMKFITDDDNDAVIDHIFTASAPSSKVWADAIIELLTWPTPLPPETDNKRDCCFRFMPLGANRQNLADAFSSRNTPLRQFIIDALVQERMSR